jgi:hypothetical protein
LYVFVFAPFECIWFALRKRLRFWTP